jgi:hypothetical protein
MVIGGYEGYDGLLRVALKLAGQSAEVVMALGEVSPEPPLGAGLVVVEEATVVEDAAVDLLLDGLKIR